MTDLSPEARALLEAARPATVPTAADRARVQQALSVALAPRLPLLPIGAAVLGGLAAVGIVAGVLWRQPPSVPTPLAAPAEVPAARPVPAPPPSDPAPVAVPQPAPAVVAKPVTKPLRRPPQAPPALPPGEQPLDMTDAPPRATEAPTRSSSSPGQTGRSTLVEELLLLQSAQALAKRDPSQALDVLAEHARRFPNGALREERIAARVSVLCAEGRVEEGRAEAERLLAESPNSPYLAKVRAACW